jgi:UTP-glucose-1-phosphate uridylyltransferase
MENVFVIPATIMVGKEMPPYLPLADGSVKPIAQCSKEEIEQAVEECRFVAQTSRERLEAAYRDHLKDVELLAQVSAYLAKYEQWAAIREGGEVGELMWQVEL